jgi:two-component system, OmpR family, alkaline phosphatase synthesis response regulator PhoP
MKNNNNIKEKIIEFLKTKEIGASANEISKKIGHNRITITKYLEIMKASKIIDYEEIAQAKLWKINIDNINPKILIIDDEPNVVELVALSLISAKYNIIKAYSGYEGLEKANSLKPDLIILDIMMPGLDGFKVCEQLKQNLLTKHIPIIILSAKDQINDKLIGIKIGADDYITKPFDPMELEARVNALIRRINIDFDINPISKLPGKKSFNKLIKNNKDNNYILNIKINNFAKYKKKFGFRKAEDLIILLSRIFSKEVKENNSFLFHTMNDNFLIISNNQKIDIIINNSFNQIMPYLFEGNNEEKNTIELNIKKIYLKKIDEKINNLDIIYNKLEID